MNVAISTELRIDEKEAKEINEELNEAWLQDYENWKKVKRENLRGSIKRFQGPFHKIRHCSCRWNFHRHHKPVIYLNISNHLLFFNNSYLFGAVCLYLPSQRQKT